jgi:hypothetical protein
MMQLLSSFLQSMLPEAMKAAGGEAIAGEAAAATQAAPMTMGQAVGDIATQSVNQQIQPAMNLYNQVTAPGATGGDMARSAFEYSIKSEKDPQNQVTIPAMAPMNPYANMANNNVGGIPSLLQNTQSGLLPFFGAR